MKDQNLGRKARDRITGFTGVITARIEYLTGCAQYGITPEAKDQKIEDTRYFDVTRVDVSMRAADLVMAPLEFATQPGGPSDAPRNMHGRRG